MRSIMHTIKCAMYTVDFTLYTVQCTLYTIYCVHSNQVSLYWTTKVNNSSFVSMNNVSVYKIFLYQTFYLTSHLLTYYGICLQRSTSFNVDCTVYSVHRTMYSVHCTLYNVVVCQIKSLAWECLLKTKANYSFKS